MFIFVTHMLTHPHYYVISYFFRTPSGRGLSLVHFFLPTSTWVRFSNRHEQIGFRYAFAVRLLK